MLEIPRVGKNAVLAAWLVFISVGFSFGSCQADDDSELVDYDFIEIGTADFETVLQYAEVDWMGVSVDVNRYYLELLPTNPNVLKIPRAISEHDSNIEVPCFYIHPNDVDEYNLPEHVRGSSQLSTPQIPLLQTLKALDLEHLLRAIMVEVWSFSRLLKETRARSISYIKIDAEGGTFSIVRGLQNACRMNRNHCPKMVSFEVWDRNGVLHQVPDATLQNQYAVERVNIFSEFFSLGYVDTTVYEHDQTFIRSDLHALPRPKFLEEMKDLERLSNAAIYMGVPAEAAFSLSSRTPPLLFVQVMMALSCLHPSSTHAHTHALARWHAPLAARRDPGDGRRRHLGHSPGRRCRRPLLPGRRRVRPPPPPPLHCPPVWCQALRDACPRVCARSSGRCGCSRGCKRMRGMLSVVRLGAHARAARQWRSGEFAGACLHVL